MSKDRIVYLGHASVLLQMQGVRILTDPLLKNRVLHLYRRSAPVPAVHYAEIDAVLISHNHWDHLDLPSLRRLDRETRIIAPRGVGAMLRRRGYANIEQLREGEHTQIGSVRVRATHANHMGGRPLVSVATASLSYRVEGARRIQFFGDTDFFPGMSEIAEDLDVALVPVSGWGPTLGVGHMDPEQAARALKLLRPRLAIPIHWGTFFPFGIRLLGRAAGDDPARLFSQLAADIAPQVEVRVLEPGEALDLEPS
ncbi:MAG: MBL fold metallo-hydrolase [Anaerolineae bacterium]|nr:MAG: MBL fold metallo-hydrolase [Anaerolineae bacterium]